jgi:hypothetical protein
MLDVNAQFSQSYFTLHFIRVLGCHGSNSKFGIMGSGWMGLFEWLFAFPFAFE